MNQSSEEGLPSGTECAGNLGSQALRTLAALVVVVAGMKLGADLLVPFLLAVFFALSLSPLTGRLEQRGVAPVLAIVISLGIAVTFLIGLLWTVSDSVVQLSAASPRYQEKVDGIAGSLVTWLTGLGVTVPESIDQLEVQPQALLGFLSSLVGELGASLSSSVIVFTVMLFMMIEAKAMPSRLSHRRRAFAPAMLGVERITKSVTEYLSVKTLISLATGVSWGLFLHLVGVDFPVLWGLIAFLLNYVPNIGSPLAAVAPVLLALIQFGWGTALVCVAGSMGINTLFGSILEPKLMGQRLGLSTLVIFLGLIFWSWVLGPVGTILSVPLTIVVKMSLQWTDDYRDLALLLGPPDPDAGSTETRDSSDEEPTAASSQQPDRPPSA